MAVAARRRKRKRPADGRLRWGAATVSAAVVTGGLIVGDLLTKETSLARLARDFPPFFLLFGTPVFVVGLLLFLIVAFVAGLRQVRRPRRWVLWPAFLLASAAVADGVYEYLPDTRFRKLVVDPVPVSVDGLRFAHADSFGDGDAWAIAFHLAPADFETVARRFDLREVSADETVGQPGVDWRLARDAVGLYRRPVDARFFLGDRKTVVVTDASRSTVFIYRDFWIDPTNP